MSSEIVVGPIEMEVISNALISIAEEMGAVLVRASQSTGIKERKDCSCTIFDANGTYVRKVIYWHGQPQIED